MKCREIQHWLLTTKADAPLLSSVRNHLLHCVQCRQKQELLQRVEQEVRQLPVPPANPTAKARLLERIKKMPAPAAEVRSPFSYPVAEKFAPGPGIPAAIAKPAETPAVSQPGIPRSLWDWRVPALATAAALLLAVGWYFGSRFIPVSPRPELAAKKPGETDAPPALVLRIAQHDAKLAAAANANERLDVLNLLAGDLREEAVRLAQKGAVEAVPLLSELYGQVLREGVVRQALLLPPAKRSETVQHLRAVDDQMTALAKKSLPLVAPLFASIGSAANQAADLIESGKQPAAPNEMSSGSNSRAVTTLVRLGLKLAAETDPLRQADLSSEVAVVVAESAVALSASGETKQATDMGTCLGDVLERGVAGNLNKVEIKGDKAKVQAAMEKIRQHSADAFAVLQKNLSGASATAKAGLEQALKAASHGHDLILQGQRQPGPGLIPGAMDNPGPGEGK